MSAHEPIPTDAEQDSPVLAVTVTVPVGTPAPGATGVTANLIVTVWPETEGFGEVAVITVAVFATVTVKPADPLLARNLASPA